MKKTVTILTAVMMAIMMIITAFAEGTDAETLRQAAEEMMNSRSNRIVMTHDRPIECPTIDPAAIIGTHEPIRLTHLEEDASGLQITEKMRGQIKGLNQASTNAQDGISMLQTAAGALNETTAILQRMKKLTVQAANSENDQDHQAEIAEMTRMIEKLGNEVKEDETIGLKLPETELTNQDLHLELEGYGFEHKGTETIIENGGNRIAEITNREITLHH